VAVHEHHARARRDDAANDVDQGRLAGAIGTQQSENFPLEDVEIDVLQRLEARGIGLGQIGDTDDGRHRQQRCAARGTRVRLLVYHLCFEFSVHWSPIPNKVPRNLDHQPFHRLP
jgi:hypothetical protein